MKALIKKLLLYAMEKVTLTSRLSGEWLCKVLIGLMV